MLRPPLGVVLAGGRGRRIGGGKAVVELEGRPLVEYTLEVLAAVAPQVVVVAKPDTELPEREGLDVWHEPPEPRHPLTGIVHALRAAGGRPVLALACDLPLVREELLRALLAAARPGDLAVVPSAGGGIQPHVALYAPEALAGLASFVPEQPLREAVLDLRPRVVDWPDELDFLNVNAPEDLLHAAAALAARRRG